jgi:hypothetical protein
MKLTLGQANEIATLAQAVVTAEDNGFAEDFIRDRYQMLKFAIPEDHILYGALERRDTPELRVGAAYAIGVLALLEVAGNDISINGLSPESRAAVEKYLAERN